jgi:hypothetical protein
MARFQVADPEQFCLRALSPAIDLVFIARPPVERPE